MAAKTSEWRPGPTVCRCCLSEGCYKDISTEYFWMGKREVYSEMLSDTFDLSISYSKSGGPNSASRLICEPCIGRLRDAAEFKRQVQECEKTFVQCLDPVTALADMQVTLELEKEVKVEMVKEEKMRLSDDDDYGAHDYGDDDDDYDDLDDQPLTKLASKIPKKEDVDVLDLLDNAKVTEKRKSSTKVKGQPSKKSKCKQTAGSSKQQKPEPKKKKGSANADSEDVVVGVKRVRKLKENVSARQMRRRRRANNELPEESEKRIAKTMMRKNAMIILECSTAWAFRWFQSVFYCSYCNLKFVEPLPLREHVRSVHLKDAPTKKIFSKLTENNMVKVDVTSLACRLCDYLIESIDTLKTHLVSEHQKPFQLGFNDGVLPFKLDADNYFCQKCPLYFTSFAKINEHMNTHYQNYICDACGKAFVSKSRFRTHVQSHEVGSFPCGDCGEVLETRAARMCHRLRVHKKGIRYTCPRCTEVFTTYYARAKHLVEGHDQQKRHYECSTCGKLFETSCKRAAHIRISHKPVEKRYDCPNCSWYFLSKSKLKRHLMTHENVQNAEESYSND
ncbi:PR domain zinc finger protein 5 isoform X21 [Bicyclus anynana]|uniref:PR domain zinc finger protein 5 isoform X21 n=1 Tax=Bicyclus anynana TaxID=110368 RepID=A0A6J1N4A5_BICAN|nr:PR domain zinc finger protein 5 isoform X21 [Bicyclus anynana]